VNLEAFPIWDLDPDLIRLGPVTIRYYGVLFATGLLLAFYIWRWQMVRGGHDREITERYLVWGVVATLVGSRLGHCFFYEPEVYLADPIRILMVWKGGLASHGATLGLIASLFIYSWKYRFSSLETMDRFAMSATMGALFVRLGNFMNSEIVGKEWHGPLAVRFPRYVQVNQSLLEMRMGHKLSFAAQALPRHPSQLYEALGAIVVFLMMLGTDRILGEKRPRGLMTGLFLAGYFTFRFLVEYVKEFQKYVRLVPDSVDKVIHVHGTAGLTMGQYLSIPFIGLGVVLIVYSLVTRKSASVPAG